MRKLLFSIYNRTSLFKHIKKHLNIPTPIIIEDITWDKNYNIKFKFTATFPIAQKAKEKGIESTSKLKLPLQKGKAI